MDASIVVALISSSASLIISVSGAVWGARQDARARGEQRELSDKQSASQLELEKLRHQLQVSDREAEHLSAAAGRLAAHRKPLLIASYELGARIDNIQKREFLSYLSASGHRGELALMSTLHRFASYLAQQEALRADLVFARLDDPATSAVADLLEQIGHTFGTDSLGPRFMLWREEQRAIGELMLVSPVGQPAVSMGYAAFAASYEQRFTSWFAAFRADLSADGEAKKSKRLERLRMRLAELVVELDTDGVYTRRRKGDAPMPGGWITRAASAQGER